MNIDFNNLTQTQEDQICNVQGMSSHPKPLSQADLNHTGGWVYDRRYGVFLCCPSSHCFVMARIYAWDLGEDDWVDVAEKNDGIFGPQRLAEDWLIKTEGTAFKSSISKKVIVGKQGNLRDDELDYFYPVTYVQNKKEL